MERLIMNMELLQLVHQLQLKKEVAFPNNISTIGRCLLAIYLIIIVAIGLRLRFIIVTYLLSPSAKETLINKLIWDQFYKEILVTIF